MKLIGVQKIWDQAAHNAFTDLIHFENQWLCAFREGTGHISPDGALRIIGSTDAVHWSSRALLTSSDSDLRDAKLSITPSNQLMLCGAEVLHNKSTHSYQSLSWFSTDGQSWGNRHEIGDPDFWLWRITWHSGTAYSMGYHCAEDSFINLYHSIDGQHFSLLAERLTDIGVPNEASLTFDNDRAYCLLRREQANGLLGSSQAPYTKWEWKDLGVPIGGPQIIHAPNGRLIAAVRLYDEGARTSLCWIDTQTGQLTEALKLPSGGDTSYAGLVWHDDLLWVSYYSSHEGKTAIYLAKIKV